MLVMMIIIMMIMIMFMKHDVETVRVQFSHPERTTESDVVQSS
jgi:hypothetical protein